MLIVTLPCVPMMMAYHFTLSCLSTLKLSISKSYCHFKSSFLMVVLFLLTLFKHLNLMQDAIACVAYIPDLSQVFSINFSIKLCKYIFNRYILLKTCSITLIALLIPIITFTLTILFYPEI